MLLYAEKSNIHFLFINTIFTSVWHIADANVIRSKSTRKFLMLSWVTNFFRYLGKQVNEDCLPECR